MKKQLTTLFVCTVMVLLLTGTAMAEAVAMDRPEDVLLRWSEANAQSEAVAEIASWQAVQQAQEKDRDEALIVAIQYIADEYAVPFEEIATYTSFVAYDGETWQIDAVPEDASQAYAIYVANAAKQVTHAYYGEGEG